MALGRRLRLALLVLANLCIPLACVIFATGFFPYKPLLPELASFEEQDATEELGILASSVNGTIYPLRRPQRVFNKVIFMVVDALRSDFVYGHLSGFNLIRDGGALPFTAHAAPPTVTMPRVKALTTGSVPSFVDLILNFAESDTSSSLASQDTWLAQIREHLHDGNPEGERPGRLHFFGDDTWLKLFPDFFATHDGTTSFFVSDFTEVDNNVTRHLPTTLSNPSWDAVVMHYLGLDHIGHKTGPEGPNMLPKQAEMDGIVRQIYEATENEEDLQNTLLVLAGDHGMNSGGNHGGSGPGETDTALVFISPKFQAASQKYNLTAPMLPHEGTDFDFYTKIQQSDMVPTLAALLGVPVPRNNLGVLIPQLLQPWKFARVKGLSNPYLQLLYRNALQVLDIVKAQYGEEGFVQTAGASMKFKKCRYGFTGKVQLRCLWSRAQRMILAADVKDQFNVDEQAEALREAGRVLSFLEYAQEDLSATASSYDVGRLVAGSVVAAAATAMALLGFPLKIRSSAAVPAFYVLTALYCVMMFATSYVEEEQHIWYWFTSAWLFFLSIPSTRAGDDLKNFARPQGFAILLIALHRLADRWNQTGQKFAGEPDISGSFFPQHTYLLWALIIFTYFLNACEIADDSLKRIFPRSGSLPVALVATVPALVFKLNFTQSDAPELIGDFMIGIRQYTSGYSLVSQAHLIFFVLLIMTTAVLAGHFAVRSMGDKTRSGRCPSLVSRLLPLLKLILLTQTRAVNVPLLLIYTTQLNIIGLLFDSDSDPKRPGHSTPQTRVARASITILLMTYTSFFQTGGSNAISSIDLSNAYNGVTSYNIVAVGVLLFLGNWAGPIWWATAGLTLLQLAGTHRRDVRTGAGADQLTEVDGADGVAQGKTVELERMTRDVLHKQSTSRTDESTPVKQSMRPNEGGPITISTTGRRASIVKDEVGAYEVYLSLATLFTAASLTSTMVACTVLRTHLFIWTVFSPKYLYAVAWAVGWHGVVNLAWGGLLWAAG